MRPGTRIQGLFALVLALAIPATAWCGGAARRHDGFLLRLSAGFGGASTDIEANDGTDIEFSGMTGDVNFAIGGMVSRNLALHGTLWGWSIGDPDVEVGGDSGELDGDLSMSAIGIGITYYFMPTNLYLSGSLGMGLLTWDLEGFGDDDSDRGLVLDATFGKEWWVSANWGLGLAGAVGFHSIPQDNFDDNWDGASLGLRFSATFN